MKTLLCAGLHLCATLALAQPGDTLRGLPWLDNAFTDAMALRIDPAGRLYVVDPGRSALLVLDPDGSVRASISGGAQLRFVEPVDVDPTNGLLRYVADRGAGLIVPVGEDGLFLDPLGAGTSVRAGLSENRRDFDAIAPASIAVSVRGDVFAVDTQQQQLIRWDASRRRTVVSGPADGVLDVPRAVAIGRSRLYVLDQRGLALFDLFGTFVRRTAGRWGADAVRVRLVDDRLVVVGPNALHFFDRDGRWQASSVWSGPPLRDVALAHDGLLLLTARTIFRIPR